MIHGLRIKGLWFRVDGHEFGVKGLVKGLGSRV